MIQRMKMDVVLLIVGITFLVYSIFGSGNNPELFRFIIGTELTIGILYCMLSPENKWI